MNFFAKAFMFGVGIAAFLAGAVFLLGTALYRGLVLLLSPLIGAKLRNLLFVKTYHRHF
jgi:hypothetical protein